MTIFIILALIGISVGLGIYAYYLHNNQKQVIQLNEERQKENERIEQEIESKRKELAGVKEVIQAQNNIVKSLTETAETMRQSAEQRAEESYQARLSALEVQYKEAENEHKKRFEYQHRIALDKVAKELAKVADLEAKQRAYIEAQQRQEEIATNQDYYRMVIESIDLNDIEMLRELQKRFFKKESIDKLIWETYYKPAYDTLMSHLFTSPGKICGIYKITDLTTGQAYIGQSVDIKERFRQHVKASLAYGGATNKLYQTMQKSGQQNFTFEILEEVPRAQLNERETYWIEFYKTKEYGLNSTKGGA